MRHGPRARTRWSLLQADKNKTPEERKAALAKAKKDQQAIMCAICRQGDRPAQARFPMSPALALLHVLFVPTPCLRFALPPLPNRPTAGFMVTSTAAALRTHAESKHPKEDPLRCFPSLATMPGGTGAAAEQPGAAAAAPAAAAAKPKPKPKKQDDLNELLSAGLAGAKKKVPAKPKK